MNREPNLDPVLDRWFTEGPTQLPDRTVAAIVERLDDLPQSRPVWPLGRIRLRRLSMVAAAVAVLAVSAVVGSGFPHRTEAPAAPMLTSPTDWSRVTIESAPGAGRIVAIAAGPRGLVAVARPDAGGESRILFSTDGRDWSAADVSPTGEYVSVVATDRGFLLTSSEQGAWTSEDGLHWQHVADDWGGNPDVGGAIVVDAIAGGPGYVSVGNHDKVWYSTGGSDWTEATVPPPPADLIRPDYPDLGADILHVVAVGNDLVATGTYSAESSTAGDITRDFVLASSDGRTWSTVLSDMGDRAGPLEIAGGPRGFLLIGGALDGDHGSTVWRSADGKAWENLGSHDFAAGSSNEVRIDGIAAASGGYVAVGTGGNCFGCRTRAVVWTSPDGRSWSELAGGEPFSLGEPGTTVSSVSALGSRFIVGGQHGGRPTIWISGQGGR